MNVIRSKGTAWIVENGDTGILIDSGTQSAGRHIIDHLSALKIRIPYIFLTHTHYDHAGSVEQIRKATGAVVIVSEHEAPFLKRGHTPVPKGTEFYTKALLGATRIAGTKKWEYYPPVEADIFETAGKAAFHFEGTDAEIFALGGHTKGSIALKIGDYLFAGDTVFRWNGQLYPPFADEPEKISSAWKTIIESSARHICPGHGDIVDVTVLQEQYAKRFNRK